MVVLHKSSQLVIQNYFNVLSWSIPLCGKEKGCERSSLLDGNETNFIRLYFFSLMPLKKPVRMNCLEKEYVTPLTSLGKKGSAGKTRTK